jgi:hypothetical protein
LGDDDGFVLRIAVEPEDMDLRVAFERWRQIHQDLAVGPVTAELLGEVVGQAAPHGVTQHLVRALQALDYSLGGLVAVKHDALAIEIAERAVRAEHVRHLTLRSRLGVGQMDDRRPYEVEVVDGYDRRDLEAGLVEKADVVKATA